MTDYREVLRLEHLGLNHSQIASAMEISRPTAITVLRRAREAEITWQSSSELSDRELAAVLFPATDTKLSYKMPDYEYIHREMAKSGVTLQLLWFEYCDKCRDVSELPYQLTQFKKYYRDYVLKNKATMHINRKPGESIEVDWAGQTAAIVDSDTGEVLDAYIFVAALPYSGYTYAEAFIRQDQEAWTAAHVNAFTYFGGVTRILVPDNLKTGVTKNTRTETVLNKSYQEMAEHYGMAILPARVRAPKDKATVEGTVGNISSFILAAVRNQTFFTLKELNEVVRQRLYAFNRKPFQKKPGSRATLFVEERAYLQPLPATAYELATWKVATTQYNYHVSVEGQFYSVPFEYIKKKVDVRLTRNTVEVFYEGNRICSHVRLRGNAGQYSTQESHMPPNHQQYLQWDGDRFRRWAGAIGKGTLTVVDGILTGFKIEQQGFRTCMGLLRLADTYTPQRLEAACAMALTYMPRPSYKSIQTLLKSGRDKQTEESAPPTTEPSPYGFTRGADYYGRGRT